MESESESEHEKETEPEPDEDETSQLISKPESTTASGDPRFDLPPPPPSAWKRFGLVLFLIFLFWAGFKMRTGLLLSKKPKVVHASRYSKEFKFRPAASPIITETLKDGRVRLRGALPEPTVAPSPPPPSTPPKKKKKKKTAGSGKRKPKARK